MTKGKVTIKEIADMAGVSIATVSHVINRTRYVSPELINKIETIIEETGYSNKIAFTYRKYASCEYEAGLLVQDGNVEFSSISIKK